MEKFVNLHMHTMYSLRDGITRPEQLVARTLEYGQPAVAVTDHGNLYCVPDLVNACAAQGQKAIVGFEAYVTRDHTVKRKVPKERAAAEEGASGNIDGEAAVSEAILEKNDHLLLLAADNEGYKRLSRLCSLGHNEGFYGKPRIDDGLIAAVGTEGLIASSACLAGRVAKYVVLDRLKEAEEVVVHYRDLFHGNFYLEIQPAEIPAQVKVNEALIDLSQRLSVPLIATTDSHYLDPEDKETHEVLLCMQSDTVMSDERRWKISGNTYWVMSRADVLAAFSRHGHEALDRRAVERALDETVALAERCNVTFSWGKPLLPKVDVDSDNAGFASWCVCEGKSPSSAAYLEYLCRTAMYGRGLAGNAVYEERLAKELRVIADMGFPDYFLIYEDIIRYCEEREIPVGPGRGCARPDCPVALGDGTRRPIRDVDVGDEVLTPDGPGRVVAVHAYSVDERLVTLRTVDGRSMTMTADHRVLVLPQAERGQGRPRWTAIGDVVPGDCLVDVTTED